MSLTSIEKILFFYHFSIISWCFHLVKIFQVFLEFLKYLIDCKDRWNLCKRSEFKLNFHHLFFHNFNLKFKVLPILFRLSHSLDYLNPVLNQWNRLYFRIRFLELNFHFIPQTTTVLNYKNNSFKLCYFPLLKLSVHHCLHWKIHEFLSF